MKKASLIFLCAVMVFSFCACADDPKEDEKLTVSHAVAARIEKIGNDKVIEITSEIDALDTFDDLDLVRPKTEIPLLGERRYIITFDPSDLVKNRSEIIVQFAENGIAINDRIYVAADGIQYADILEWAESKYAYFSGNIE